jgi:DNA-binding Lrp family transcriptional regulator
LNEIDREYSAESSLFYVITAAVLHDKSLCSDDKILFALLTGLSNKYGYCFASNLHLCEQMNLQERTLQRSLDTLEKNGYIRREIRKDDRNKFKTIRRIYIVIDRFKQSLRDDKSDTLGQVKNDRVDPSDLSGIVYNSSCTREDNTSEVAEAPSSRVAKGSPPPSPKARELALSLLEAVKKTKPDLKKPNLRSWEADFDKMLRIDNRTPEAVEKVIEALPTLDFWSTRVLSADKFRIQFDKLELVIFEAKKKGTSKEQPNREIAEMAFNMHNHRAHERKVKMVLNGYSIEIRKAGTIGEEIFFSDPAPEFKWKLERALKACGLSV